MFGTECSPSPSARSGCPRELLSQLLKRLGSYGVISSLNINKPGYKHQLCKKGDFFFVRLCLPTLKYSPVASSIGVSRHGDFSFNPAFII